MSGSPRRLRCRKAVLPACRRAVVHRPHPSGIRSTYRVPHPLRPRNVLAVSHIVAICHNRSTVYEKVLLDHLKGRGFAYFGIEPTCPSSPAVHRYLQRVRLFWGELVTLRGRSCRGIWRGGCVRARGGGGSASSRRSRRWR